MKYDPNNIFAKIIRGELPSSKVYEDEHVIAFEDKFKQAPLHILVLPKGEYISFDDFVEKADAITVDHFFKKVREIAHKFGVEGTGYRLIMNHGADGMQMVPHFHLHILAKKRLGPLVMGDMVHAG